MSDDEDRSLRERQMEGWRHSLLFFEEEPCHKFHDNARIGLLGRVEEKSESPIVTQISARQRAEISPVVGDPTRPLWSVMIPTYNCARYLRVALESVLAEDIGPAKMQIEVVDDCSSDDVREVVAELGGGRITFFQQSKNVGQAINCATCIQRARGYLVHLLHGDDAVRPGFYSTMERPFDDIPELGAAFCGYVAIDERGSWEFISARTAEEPGVLEGWLERVAVQNHAPPSATVVRRSVYERLGGFDEHLRMVDWDMWVRIAACYPVWYEPQPLTLYRRHQTSISGSSSARAAIVEMRRVVESTRTLLPEGRKAELTSKARENIAIFALERGLESVKRGETSTALGFLVDSVRTSRSRAVFLHAVHIGPRVARATLLRKKARAGSAHT